MLTAAEIAAMREAQEQALPETCVRTRTALVPTAGGGYTDGESETISLACRISSNGVPQEYLRQGVATGRVPVMITVPHGSDVVGTDTLAVGGVEYHIIGMVSVGTWATALRCVCEATG